MKGQRFGCKGDVGTYHCAVGVFEAGVEETETGVCVDSGGHNCGAEGFLVWSWRGFFSFLAKVAEVFVLWLIRKMFKRGLLCLIPVSVSLSHTQT